MSRTHNTPVPACPTSEVCIRQPDGRFNKTSIGVERLNFYEAPAPKLRGQKKKGEQAQPLPPAARLVIGFDTEYVAMKGATREQIAEGEAKYRVLSYQVWCQLWDPDSTEHGNQWGDVFYPTEGDERFGLDTLINFAIWKGVTSEAVTKVPRQVELVCHYGKADMPALSDFRGMAKLFQAVRNCFITLEDICLRYALDGEPLELKVRVRDTHLLAAEGSKALSDLGRVTDVPKVSLSDDPVREQFLKENMDVLLEEDPELFHTYALTDAIICVQYFDQMRELAQEIIGTPDVPLTLSGMGVERLMRFWEADPRIDVNDVRGLEEVETRTWNEKAGRYRTKKLKLPIDVLNLGTEVANEAYHGGRAEQYWFGPGVERTWTDYDLSSAYPTAMSLIGYPDWKALRPSTSIDDFTYQTLGVALVRFRFPKTVQYPVLPVRTDHGLIFPLSGESYASAPEIALARSYGAELDIKFGVVIPYREDVPAPFADFVADGIRQRSQHPKGSLKNLSWKEQNNATYGKLAQGLKKKRVYSLRDEDTVPLPPSKITNAFYASYTTGFVRAVLGEIMNALPGSAYVFSCTTDGFLSSATANEIAEATKGDLCNLYRQARVRLLTIDGEAPKGADAVVEVKKSVKRPLGWRARGQATLVPGDDPAAGDSGNIVLAKTGLRAPWHCRTLQEQNDYIVDLFLHREAGQKHEMKSLTGTRDIVELGNDLVDKTIIRRLNMEYDFKRRPVAGREYVVGNVWHITLVTEPWEKVEDFLATRAVLEEHVSSGGACLRERKDFEAFAAILAAKTGVERPRYVNKKDPDTRQLLRSLCSAWQHGKAGIDGRARGQKAPQFAKLLTEVGLECRRYDVENGSNKPFQLRRCPDTPRVRHLLERLRETFPALDEGELLASKVGVIDLTTVMTSGVSGSVRLPLELKKLPRAA